MKIKLKIDPKTIRNWQKLGKGIVKSFLIILLCILCFQYFQTEIYEFNEPSTFRGDVFYNPYSNWKKENTIKANFHAHSIEWLGLTNGHNTVEEIGNAYKKLGYEVAALSNYHKINKKLISNIIEIPTFEHGYNISKSHLLGIDAKGTTNLDFPIVQGTSQKQMKIIDLKQSSTFVALAHPGLRNGFSKEDLKYLKGYSFMEVLSPYFNSISLWDFALSMGNLSWLLANDDTHDLVKQTPGRFFNLISTQTKEKESVLKSMKIGNHLAYKSENGLVDVQLDYINIYGKNLKYKFVGEISQAKIVINGMPKTIDNFGEIKLDDSIKYLRFEVAGKKSTLYSNPIFRTKSLPNALAQLGNIQSIKYSKNETNNYRIKTFGLALLLFVVINFSAFVWLIRQIRNQFLQKPKFSVR